MDYDTFSWAVIESARVARRDLTGAREATSEWWRSERARRREERAEIAPRIRDAKRAAQRARRVDTSGTKSETHRAERELHALRRARPCTMTGLVFRLTVGGATVGYAGWEMTPAWHHLEVLSLQGVAAAIAAGWLASAVWRGARGDKGALRPTAEERRLMGRLKPEFWHGHAEVRGLAGTLTGDPQLTPAGLVTTVRLDGKWTVGKLREANESVRALLGARTALKMAITAGSHGGWATLTLRTRSAADGSDLLWSPGLSWAVNTETGAEINPPAERHMLFAGMSGAGKSVASRYILWRASESTPEKPVRLVIIDLKKVEGRLWDHRARVAFTAAQVVRVVSELVTEMHERLDLMPKGVTSWSPTEERPFLYLVVDEGAEVMSLVKDAMDDLETLARMARAAGIFVEWMTQKPTLGDGVPRQVAAQLGVSISLAVKSTSEARVVFGDDAQQNGWRAEELDFPGEALIRDGKTYKPEPLRVRFMTNEMVMKLPETPIWVRELEADGTPSLTMLPGGGEGQPAETARLTDTDRAVLAALQEMELPARQVDVAVAVKRPSGTVSKCVGRLVAAGLVARTDEGLVLVEDTEEVAR